MAAPAEPSIFTFQLKDLLPADRAGAELNDVYLIAVRVVHLALDLAGILALIMVLYASIIYLTSFGDESKAEIAKKTLLWSAIGFAVIILSKYLLTLIKNIFS